MNIALKVYFLITKKDNSIYLTSNNDTLTIQIKDDEKSILAFANNYFVADRLEFKIKQNLKNAKFEDAGYISMYNVQNSLKFKYKRESKMDSLDDLEFIFNLTNKKYPKRFLKDISTILQMKEQEELLQKNAAFFLQYRWTKIFE